ncbi:glycoside hydrolase family 113 [Aquimarina agarivorans]|uniref:glycoside hydrolase family 113 n=1 Tax=Aquimarina agarivorans TaxID=980584 RepID=UPI000248EA2C|nr:hypothetical protein [Aquimarina agarivorans]
MLLNKIKLICIFKYLLPFVSIAFAYAQTNSLQLKKINGANLVSPPTLVAQKTVASVKQINANWVAVIPYAFTKGHTPQVYFNTNFQWWGEKFEGTSQLIEYAKNEKLKVMLKPHIWVKGDGWAGDFMLKSESDWLIFEKHYTDYILSYAKIAQRSKVELLCIATEFRNVVKQRPQFWCNLIQKIKSVYTGKLTYAANWDNYENVTFWNELDYIGIDVYFPLSKNKTPTVTELTKLWQPITKNLQHFSSTYNKPILFTEYGYKSCDYSTAGHWNTDGKEIFNSKAQMNAYEALYENFWNKNWIAGGFLWKWHLTPINAENTRFTPQQKPVVQIIKKYYK